MKTTIDEIYDKTIKPLPMPDRLRLATRILNDLPPETMVDYSEEWSEEDIRDARLYSLRRTAQSFGEEENDA